MSEELSSSLAHHMDEFLHALRSGSVVGPVTQYTIWTIIVIIVLLAVVFYCKKHVEVVPSKSHGFASMIEHLADWVRRDVAKGVIGEEDYRKHLPFLLSLFFFILIANLLGLIPGFGKAATGTISMTAALALVSFVYFNYYGMKAQGVGKYWLNLAPKGVIFPLNVLVWCIELLSLFLRFVTLAVRLFANMYAGHIVMGAFASLASVFLIQAIAKVSVMVALPSLGWILLLIAMYAMEFMVACIQAYVFTLLSAVYIYLATNEH